MIDVWEEINQNQYALVQSLKTLRPNWEAFAKAETDYRIAKAQGILSLKAKGYPTTLIPDLVKGLKDVAELNLCRIIAEATYKTNIEAINVYKQRARDLRMYFEKEYSNENE